MKKIMLMLAALLSTAALLFAQSPQPQDTAASRQFAVWLAAFNSGDRAALQQYFENNPYQPYCAFVVSPKVQKFRKKFADRFKKAGSVSQA